MNENWVVEVHEISLTDYGDYWVNYFVFNERGFEMHEGDRILTVQDELDLFVVFRKQMLKRWGTNNVRWEMK